MLCDDTVERFAMYAANVWDTRNEDVYQAAKEGIDKTAAFFTSLGMPSKLSEVGIGEEKFKEMAEEAVRTSGISERSYYHLFAEDIVKIFESVK